MNHGIQWLLPHKPVSEAEINQLGRAMGIAFPADYMECARLNHGGHPKPGLFDFEGHPEAVFDKLLSYDPSSKGYILAVYRFTRERLSGNIIPFANDPFGNLICFEFDDNHANLRSVVFYDHETLNADRKAGISRICGSFSELLSMLRD